MDIETNDSNICVRSIIPSKQSQNLARSRPTSLIKLAPEKEALAFDINLTGAPPEVESLIEHIKIVAEQFLYHWKTFPISKIQPLNSSKCEKIISVDSM